MKRPVLRRGKKPDIPTFPPKKQFVDLQALLDKQEIDVTTRHDEANCFEDANNIYLLSYRVVGPNLTFAMDKNLYYNGLDYFDLSLIRYDVRFILGRKITGKLMLGNYTDNNLGRVFHLTEPKDATHMYLSLLDGLDDAFNLDWLESEPNVCYFYHFPSPHLHLVLPIGSRIDYDYCLLTIPNGKDIEDRGLFQGLFEEQLQRFAGIPVRLTEYVDREADLAIEELREIEKANQEGAKRHKEVEEKVETTNAILTEKLADYLKEFGLGLKVELADEFLKIGPREIVMLTLFDATKPEDIIFKLTREFETFASAPLENIIESYTSDISLFLDSERETFKAYKRLYDVNKSYHDYVNPASREPILSYPHIFGAISIPY